MSLREGGGGWLLHLPRHEADDAAPAKLDAQAVAEGIIEAVCPSFDLCQNLGIVIGDAGRESLLALLDLPVGLPVESCRGDALKVRILGVLEKERTEIRLS